MALTPSDIKWAELTEYDPTVDENNKAPIPTAIKTSGLKDQQPLPRQWLNQQFHDTWKLVESLQEQINNLTQSSGDYVLLLQTLFRVGDIWTTQSEDTPADRFGFGTWEKIESRFLVASSTTDSDFIGAGTRGGTKTHSHSDNFSVASHTLTEAQVPTYVHSHDYRDRYYIENSTSPDMQAATNKEFTPTNYNSKTGSNGSDLDNNQWLYYDTTTESDSFGGGGSHTHGLNGGIYSTNTLPPYEVFHVWRRTA